MNKGSIRKVGSTPPALGSKKVLSTMESRRSVYASRLFMLLKEATVSHRLANQHFMNITFDSLRRKV